MPETNSSRVLNSEGSPTDPGCTSLWSHTAGTKRTAHRDTAPSSKDLHRCNTWRAIRELTRRGYAQFPVCEREPFLLNALPAVFPSPDWQDTVDQSQQLGMLSGN